MKNPSKKLSAEGQTLVRDLRNVVEQAKILMLTKNQGNLIQDFIWQTQSIGSGNAQVPGAPIDKDTARQHGQQAKEGLRTLGELLITNGQFRKLLNDFITLIRDIVGDGATNVAQKVNPSEDALNQIDQPAEDNTWHDKPDLSRDNLKNQVQSRVPIGKKDVQDAAGNATQTAHPSGSRDPADAADLAARDQQEGGNSGVDAQSGAKVGAENLKNKVDANTDDDQKEKARQYREKTRNYFKGKMPKERRDQVIFRLKKMVVEIQGHPECRFILFARRLQAYTNWCLQIRPRLTHCWVWPRSILVTRRTSPANPKKPPKVPMTRIACSWLKLTSRCVSRIHSN